MIGEVGEKVVGLWLGMCVGLRVGLWVGDSDGVCVLGASVGAVGEVVGAEVGAWVRHFRSAVDVPMHIVAGSKKEPRGHVVLQGEQN